MSYLYMTVKCQWQNCPLKKTLVKKGHALESALRHCF
jgi:hypothetical protein